jgi:hypothetical protein
VTWPGKRDGVEARGDHGHLSADQTGHQRRQAIELALYARLDICYRYAFGYEAFKDSGVVG